MKTNDFTAWQTVRSQGRFRYFLINGIVLYGIPLLIVMSLITRAFTHGLLAPEAMLHYIVWPLTGLLLGVLSWYNAEAQYQHELRRRQHYA